MLEVGMETTIGEGSVLWTVQVIGREGVLFAIGTKKRFYTWYNLPPLAWDSELVFKKG